MAMEHTHFDPSRMEAPRRNRYFYGKLLDAYHFELETDYHNAMRRLHNRLVSGYGVVCGLDVRPAPEDPTAVVLTPGFAIDRQGREIIVDQPTEPLPIPPDLLAAAAENEKEREIHIDLCYHECPAEPTPVLAGDCGELEACQPGVIRERYKLLFERGAIELHPPRLLIEDVIKGRIHPHIYHRELVEHLTRTPCPPPPDVSCLPLANLELTVEGGEAWIAEEGIDVSIRPIVYNNDLLYQLLLSLIKERGDYRTQK